jgi:hypothetical protein
MLVCLVSLSSFGQIEDNNQELKTVVGVSPIRLWNGLRIKYERVLNDKVTYGGILTGYYASFPGVQLAPIARFYFKKQAPEGLYAQAKVVAGLFQNEYLASGNVKKKQTFFNTGAGIALGYQLLWGKDNRWSIDLNMGAKFVGSVPTPDDIAEGVEGNLGKVVDIASWHLTGPGSIFDGLVSIGYRF